MEYNYNGNIFVIGKSHICYENIRLEYIDNILTVVKGELDFSNENILFKKNKKYQFTRVDLNKKTNSLDISFKSELGVNCTVYRMKHDKTDETNDLLKYFTNNRKEKLERIING